MAFRGRRQHHGRGAFTALGLQGGQATRQQIRRHRAQRYELAGKQGAETVNQVGQLTHIAWPAVGLQGLHEIIGEAHRQLARPGKAGGKKLQQLRNVF